ncbi:MAG: SgcJ/EcaC family oxidoreductase [Gammaproteobacteria bacterium]
MHLKKYSVTCLSAFLLAWLAVSPALAGNATDRAEKLNEKWNTAFNQGDATAVAALYAEDAILSPGNGETIKGRAAIQELFQGFIDNGVHDHSIEVIEAHQSGDVLYEVARWQAHGTNENGETTSFGGILANTFYRDEEGNWRSRLHIWNMGN